MTALLQLGAFVGAAMSGFFADRYSRKASIGKLQTFHPPRLSANLVAVGIVIGALGS
jgi:MFS family permease